MTDRGNGFNLIGEVMDDKICKQKIGFECLEFNGIKIIPMKDIPDDRIYLVNPQNFKIEKVILLRGNIFVRFFRELRRRVRNAWSMLKGGDLG